MDLYALHPDPENAPDYERHHETVPELVWERYKDRPAELRKREGVLAKDAVTAYRYAWHILGKPFPAGEAAIAKDADCAYWYALQVLKGPFPAGEATIATDVFYARVYARYVLDAPCHCGPW